MILAFFKQAVNPKFDVLLVAISSVISINQFCFRFKKDLRYSIISTISNKSTTNDILLHFLLVLCEYKAVLVVLDDLRPGAKDALILN